MDFRILNKTEKSFSPRLHNPCTWLAHGLHSTCAALAQRLLSYWAALAQHRRTEIFEMTPNDDGSKE